MPLEVLGFSPIKDCDYQVYEEVKIRPNDIFCSTADPATIYCSTAETDLYGVGQFSLPPENYTDADF